MHRSEDIISISGLKPTKMSPSRPVAKMDSKPTWILAVACEVSACWTTAGALGPWPRRCSCHPLRAEAPGSVWGDVLWWSKGLHEQEWHRPWFRQEGFETDLANSMPNLKFCKQLTHDLGQP